MGHQQYAELHAHSAFTFLEGADTPAQLVQAAHALELSGIAVLDIDGMYSAVQTAKAGETYGVRIVHGSELTLAELKLPELKLPELALIKKGVGLTEGSEDPGLRLPVLAKSQGGYHRLCSLLSHHFLDNEGRRQAEITAQELKKANLKQSDLVALTGTARGPLRRALRLYGLPGAHATIEVLKDLFGPNNVLVEANLQPHDSNELADALAMLAKDHDLPLVATGAARCAKPDRQALADVLTATRMRLSLAKAEPHLPAWRSFLRSANEMHQLHSRHPEAVANAADLAKDFSFDLNILDPGLPRFPTPAGHDEESWLRQLSYEGALNHYGTRSEHPGAWQLIDHELQIINDLGFPGYFLIVKDIVDFCKDSGILCQGRGSAANSAVCYALGITAVDAVRHKMLFERFLSPERSGAPDIDLDIEAKERERVIQYVYSRYGRTNAAQVANVITYRPKSAVRDAGRAFGFAEGQVNRWSNLVGRGRSNKTTGMENSEIPGQVLSLAASLQKLPRHMGIHPGGMVLTQTPVSKVCPVMWAAKEGRTVLQWDKEDCADAGLVKFDLLGLGMLTALRRAFNWLTDEGVTWQGRPLDLHNLPQEDPKVYDLLCAADTVGIFQVESRAQMNTLPRLKPRCFYDIVIEVALIRPGPIQGKSVNPYLRRKNGHEAVTYLHPLLKPALEKTLGVPIFQEQLMQIAVDVAGFTAGQADELRRAIGAKRSTERMEALRPTFFAGMAKNGVTPDVQEKIFDQLRGFSEFGFPESHSFSFAYLVYASAWLKVHYPAHFYAAILASQPMGFYSPASVVEDACRHDVTVLPTSVVHSFVLTTPVSKESFRLGLETVKGLGKAAERIVEARAQLPFQGLPDLAARAKLSQAQVEKLALSGALNDLGVTRREGLWSASVVGSADWSQPYLSGTEIGAKTPDLPTMGPAEEVLADFVGMGLSTGEHPISFVRPYLTERQVTPLDKLPEMNPGKTVLIAGIVTHRQRPSTAKGTTFLSLEDETGLANVICSPGLWRRYRQVAHEARALVIRGRVEEGDGAIALVADKLEALPVSVPVRSRDFR